MSNRIRGLLVGVITVSILNLQLFTAYASPGDLDTTFAGAGLVRTGFGGGVARGYAVAAQTDGKWVMAGLANVNYPNSPVPEFAVARFTTNNVLDPSFGQGGRVLTPVPLGNYQQVGANAVQIQADGKIVVAGYASPGTNTDFTLARYNTDGSLDTSFGTNGTGIVYTDLGQQSQISAMTFQGDGKIVVVGFLGSPGASAAGIALARYQTNGVLDNTFGSGGVIATPGSEYDALFGVMIEPDGKIVAVGGANGAVFAVYRFTTNGVPDTTFGGTGRVTTSFGSSAFAQARAVAYQFANSPLNPSFLVVAGTFDISATGYLALVRYNLDGSVDTSFGSSGIVTNAFPSSGAVSVLVTGFSTQPRKIVIAGYGSDAINNYFAVARYNSAGALDTTFGTNGTGMAQISVVARANGGYAVASGMAFPSGEFLLAGNSESQDLSTSQFAAARFTGSGAPDTSFGNGGVVTADISDRDSEARAVAIQANGAIVAAGGFNSDNRIALARYNADGSLDGTFGTNGKVTTGVGTNNANAFAVQIQTDGKILVAGGAGGGFAIARFLSNGLLDSSFGTGGATNTTLSKLQQANAIAVQADGKAVLAGYTSDSTPLFGLARYTTNGSLDTSFGGSGAVTTAITANTSEAEAVRIQRDGKIVAAGIAVVGASPNVSYDFALARYNTNGSLDTSFGSFGRVTTDFGSGNGALAGAMAIQPDGKIIVAGEALIPLVAGGSTYFALARYTTNGALDTTFGTGGQVVTQVEFDKSAALSLALQPDGKIVAAGLSQIGTNNEYAVVRYNPDGSLDNTYGNGGEVLVSFNDGGSDSGYGVALDQAGRAVVAGSANSLFGVTRLLGDVLPVSLTILLSATNTAVVSWPYPSAGWNLQQNSDLITGNWVTPPETVTNDGTNNFIIVSPPTGNLFFRLEQ